MTIVRSLLVARQQIRQAPEVDLESATRSVWPPVLGAMIAGAWLIAVVAQSTGHAGLLHHHALIEGGPPLWVAVPLFLLTWQVMIVAMMLPASLPAIRVFAKSEIRGQSRFGLAGFLAGYAITWTVFGLLAFMGDLALHHLVDTTPWLAASPWLINASLLAAAGAYQCTSWKRRSLGACRHPGPAPGHVRPGVNAVRLGLEHGVDCLGSSWALMLVMFAAGFANLWWMAALTAVMVYEATGRHGRRAASVVGVVLVLVALLVVSSSSQVI